MERERFDGKSGVREGEVDDGDGEAEGIGGGGSQ